ncbi:MAG: RecX family transcriptional regulator [Rhizobacter sp.]|nr:RecX family transcriptional regulator [Ferruginibacter sp.]
MLQKNIGTEKAWQKIKHYCAYQERSHAETRDKLYGFGLYKPEVETLLSQLIEENYLNEERYAIAFAGGHFRMKQWGRVKIKYELQQKRVSAYCVKKAIATIDDADYLAALQKLAKAKLANLKSEKNIFVKKTKLRNYLMEKGFEGNLIMEVVNGM